MTQSLVILAPAYDDRSSVAAFLADIRRTVGTDVHVVLVDDASIRHPIDPGMLAAEGLRGTVITLVRNLGHQRAIAVGLGYIAETLPCERVVVMDSDGEDRPETMVPLLAALDAPDVDIVVAERRKRVESLKFTLFYALYTYLFLILTGKRVGFGNFMAIRGPVIGRLSAMTEIYIHFAGGVIASGLRYVRVPTDRSARYAGTSKMNFVDLALHGFRCVMVFAENVLIRVGVFFAVMTVGLMLTSITAVALKMLGYATPGWFSITIGILIVIFLQTGILSFMVLLLTGVIKLVLTQRIGFLQFISRVDVHDPPDPGE